MQLQPQPEPGVPKDPLLRTPVSPGLMLFLLGGLVVAGLFLLAGFDASSPSRSNGGGFDAVEVLRGRMLATNQCAACHLHPEPGIADKLTWAMDILPGHAKWLGMETPDWRSIPAAEQVRAAGVFPERPRLTDAEWRAICAAYLASAPAGRLTNIHAPPLLTQAHFNPVAPHYRRPPAVPVVKIDPGSSGIYLGNAAELKVDLVLADRGQIGSLTLDSPPSAVQVTPEGLYITVIGSLAPSDEPLGKVAFIGRDPSGQPAPPRLLLSGLRRPMETLIADLDKDGRPDLIVPERGQWLGRLAWHRNLDGTNYASHVLLERAAAVQAHIHDINQDGLPEVFALVAGGREGIYLFLNRGQGQFIMTPLVEHHPAWAGTSFDLADFNGDGHVDILATNGGEPGPGGRAPAPKDYHGVRVHLNNGRNQFSQVVFLPMQGAAKALARDFDRDGDLDIAAIATFPDYDRPQPLENFVYYRNEGGWMFVAITPPEALRGRWAGMDAADGDNDGDVDIVLGADNTSAGAVPARLAQLWSQQGVPVLVLDNQIIRPQASGAPAPSGTNTAPGSPAGRPPGNP